MKLSKLELKRYSRQIMIPEIGRSGQGKLAAGKLLIIGCGGLGSAAAFYLAAAGIGTLGLADSDKVDISNLQRQILHSSKDLGQTKLKSAQTKLKKLNPGIKIISYAKRITKNNIYKIIAEYDFILDCTDNFESKFLINDACVQARKPFSHAGVNRFIGQALTYVPGNACYRCIFENPPALKKDSGIIGVTAGLLGIIQASEAIKYTIQTGKLLINRLLTIDLLNLNFREIKIKPNPKCICQKL